MSKILWHTMTIKVPSEMVEYNEATGRVSVKKTLTKTLNISKSKKIPAIKLVRADVDKPEIVNPGKKWDVEELKETIKKAKKTGDEKYIKKIREKYNRKKELGKAIVKKAKELVARKKEERANKILSDADKLIEELKKLKKIKMKEKTKDNDKKEFDSYYKRLSPKDRKKFIEDEDKTKLNKPTKEQFVENFKDLTKEEQTKVLIKQLSVGKKKKKIDPEVFFEQMPFILSKSASRALPLLVNLGFAPEDLQTMYGAKSFDFYPTPIKCLDEIYNEIPANFKKSSPKLLEGTAGLGGVSYYFYKKGFDVTSNEYNTQLFDIMNKLLPQEIETTNRDFFDIKQIDDDAIFLNPPFMKGVQLKFLLKAIQLIKNSSSKSKVKYIFFISPWLTAQKGDQ